MMRSKKPDSMGYDTPENSARKNSATGALQKEEVNGKNNDTVCLKLMSPIGISWGSFLFMKRRLPNNTSNLQSTLFAKTRFEVFFPDFSSPGYTSEPVATKFPKEVLAKSCHEWYIILRQLQQWKM